MINFVKKKKAAGSYQSETSSCRVFWEKKLFDQIRLEFDSSHKVSVFLRREFDLLGHSVIGFLSQWQRAEAPTTSFHVSWTENTVGPKFSRHLGVLAEWRRTCVLLGLRAWVRACACEWERACECVRACAPKWESESESERMCASSEVDMDVNISVDGFLLVCEHGEGGAWNVCMFYSHSLSLSLSPAVCTCACVRSFVWMMLAAKTGSKSLKKCMESILAQGQRALKTSYPSKDSFLNQGSIKRLELTSLLSMMLACTVETQQFCCRGCKSLEWHKVGSNLTFAWRGSI